jgi:hypothetical protein
MFTASISSAYSSWISTDAEAAAFGDHAAVRWRRAEPERGEGRKPGASGVETEVEAEMGAAAATRRSEQAGGGAIAMAASLRSCCVLVCRLLGVLVRRERGVVFRIREAGIGLRVRVLQPGTNPLSWPRVGSGVWKAVVDSEGRSLHDVLENFEFCSFPEFLLELEITVSNVSLNCLVNKSNVD